MLLDEGQVLIHAIVLIEMVEITAALYYAELLGGAPYSIH